MTLANYSNTKSHKKIIMGQFNRNPKFSLFFFLATEEISEMTYINWKSFPACQHILN